MKHAVIGSLMTLLASDAIHAAPTAVWNTDSSGVPQAYVPIIDHSFLTGMSVSFAPNEACAPTLNLYGRVDTEILARIVRRYGDGSWPLHIDATPGNGQIKATCHLVNARQAYRQDDMLHVACHSEHPRADAGTLRRAHALIGHFNDERTPLSAKGSMRAIDKAAKTCKTSK